MGSISGLSLSTVSQENEVCIALQLLNWFRVGRAIDTFVLEMAPYKYLITIAMCVSIGACKMLA